MTENEGAARGQSEALRHGDVEPHLRTDAEKRELFPHLEILADCLCQTQAYIFHALKRAGLTVVLLNPSAREVAPENRHG